MLTEDRLNRIISMVNLSGSVTTTELMETLDTSESTIRRALSTLDRQKRLKKVRGGAIAVKSAYGTQDDEVTLRKGRNAPEKQRIASYAATLIADDDFVFLDAGTTTELMIPFITARGAKFVTNSLSHAMKLSEQSLTVYILGGEFKTTTEAIVGEEAIESLRKYNFTKGFFGTNGVSESMGYTTPEVRESLLKAFALQKCLHRYILADASKLGQVAAITFGAFDTAQVLTDRVTADFAHRQNVTEVKRL